MCLKHIGPTVDIHGGGTELVFPHHENEILQSEALNGVQFVKYWMHNGLLLIDQEKMSKSLKNFFPIGDVLKKFSPETVRFFILNASYRQPLDYNEDSLEEAGKALQRLQNTYDTMSAAVKSANGSDDAVQICEKLWKKFERRVESSVTAVYNINDIEALLAKESLIESEIDTLVRGRDAARKTKDFALADRIRKRLAELGIEIQDTKEGAAWKRKGARGG